MQKILIKQTDNTPQKFDSKKNNCGVIVKIPYKSNRYYPTKILSKIQKIVG